MSTETKPQLIPNKKDPPLKPFVIYCLITVPGILFLNHLANSVLSQKPIWGTIEIILQPIWYLSPVIGGIGLAVGLMYAFRAKDTKKRLIFLSGSLILTLICIRFLLTVFGSKPL